MKKKVKVSKHCWRNAGTRTFLSPGQTKQRVSPPTIFLYLIHPEEIRVARLRVLADS